MTVAAGPRHAVPARLDPAILDGFDGGAPVVDLTGNIMGTCWRVRLALPSGRAAAGMKEAVARRLADIVDEMSHWDAGSHLCRFNRAAAGAWIALPPDFATVMRCALDIARRSDGAFDPAIGRLTALWGLGPDPGERNPSDAAIADALAAGGWRRTAFDEASAHLHQPGGLWLDLSGIAKGYAADVVADRLAAMGVRHALVEIGGECAGRGIRPDGDPWWVELETPPGMVLPPLRVAVHGIGVATSGDYLAGAHGIDPATGRPAIHATTAVSVIHDRCVAADAWASALSVLPPDAARMLAERERLAVRMIDRTGGEWLSQALTAML